MAQLTFLETFSEQVLNTKNEPESSNSVILGKNLGQKITFKKRRIYNPITLKFNSLNKILNKHRMNNNNVIAQFGEYFSIITISGKISVLFIKNKSKNCLPIPSQSRVEVSERSKSDVSIKQFLVPSKGERELRGK